jgi:hypothetical protein
MTHPTLARYPEDGLSDFDHVLEAMETGDGPVCRVDPSVVDYPCGRAALERHVFSPPGDSDERLALTPPPGLHGGYAGSDGSLSLMGCDLAHPDEGLEMLSDFVSRNIPHVDVLDCIERFFASVVNTLDFLGDLSLGFYGTCRAPVSEAFQAVTSAYLSTALVAPQGLLPRLSTQLNTDVELTVQNVQFCLHCTPWLEQVAELHDDDDWYADVHVPLRCCRCTLRRHQSHRDGVETKVVRFWMPHDPFSNATVAVSMKMSLVKRNLGNNLNNIFDARSAADFTAKNEAMLHYFTRITSLEHVSLDRVFTDSSISWQRWTLGVVNLGAGIFFFCCMPLASASVAMAAAGLTSCMVPRALRACCEGAYEDDTTGCSWATPWRPSKVEGYKGEGYQRSKAQSMQDERTLDTGGVIPTRTVVDDALVENLPIVKEHMLAPGGNLFTSAFRQNELIRMEESGKCYYGDPDGMATKVGPLLGSSVVHNANDLKTRCSAILPRLLTRDTYDVNSDMHKRCVKFTDVALREVFTEAAIRRAAVMMPEIESLAPEKYSEAAVRAAFEECISLPRMRRIVAITKAESVAKAHKPARLVLDEGLKRQMAALMVVSVFERLLYGHLRHCTIKHRNRDTVMNDISHRLSSRPFRRRRPPSKDVDYLNPVAMEVDQTCFDSHERLDRFIDGEYRPHGLLQHEHRILRRITEVIAKINYVERAWEWVLQEEEGTEWVLDFKDLKTSEREKDKVLKLAFCYLFRTSGNRRTSSANLFVELMCTLCACTANPWAIWTHNLDTWCFDFEAIQSTKKSPRLLRFLPFVEGDDLLAQTESWLRGHVNEIMACYESVGLIAKLDFRQGTPSRPDRAEFCGIHFLIINGLTKRGCWVPDVVRTITNSGVYVSREQDPAKRAANVIASFYSRARMFQGRFTPMFEYMLALARDWCNKVPAAMGESASNHSLQSTFGESVIRVDAFERMIDDYAGVEIHKSEQMSVLAASVGGPVSVSEYGKWLGFAPAVTVDCDTDTVMAALPLSLQAKLLRTFTA